MISLKTLLSNPYANEEVTDIRLDGAAQVLLPKLIKANTDLQYTTSIATITDCLNPFHTKIVAIATDLSINKGLTEKRVKITVDFRNFVRDNYMPIQVLYKNNHTKLLQFYPSGMKTYNTGNKSKWLALMEFYGDAATTNSADFSGTFVEDANKFAGKYTAAADIQEEGVTSIGLDRSSRDNLRESLETALFMTMHTVFAVSKGSQNYVKAIIDLKSLEYHPRTSIQHFNSVINAGVTINIMFANFDISYVVFAKNTGDTDIQLCLSPTINGACSSNNGLLKAGKSKTFIMPLLGELTNQYLNITNLDPALSGKYEIEVYRQ